MRSLIFLHSPSVSPSAELLYIRYTSVSTVGVFPSAPPRFRMSVIRSACPCHRWSSFLYGQPFKAAVAITSPTLMLPTSIHASFVISLAVALAQSLQSINSQLLVTDHASLV